MSPSMTKPSRRATIADLDALPGDGRAELIDDVIYEVGERDFESGHVRTRILMDIVPPYEIRATGADRWWVQGPNDFVAGGNVFRPDLLGWRRLRLPSPSRTERVDVVPDWIGELINRENRDHVLGRKRPAYAKLGVKQLWLVEISERVLTALELSDGVWRELGKFAAGEGVHLPPFEAVRLETGAWWPPEAPLDRRER